MKKIITIIAIISVISLSSVFFIFQNYDNNKNKTEKYSENDNKADVIQDQDDNKPNTEIENDSKKEEDKDNKNNEEKDTNTNKPTNNVTSKPNTNTNKPNNNTTNKPSDINKPEINNSQKPVETPKVKSVCNSSNEKWVSYLSKWKANNPTAVVFDTQKDAIAYGEYSANNFGYAYKYNSIPVKYEDEECKKEIWFTRLSAPQGECVDSSGNYNKEIWLNATKKENLIDYFDYLRNKGYDCGTKKWYR